ncbi:MAG: hypothetical protein FD123_2309 [Bacteroidetes bacterium]|nr:MAG: hypothetical protein FD123_2309 [Bacteroidota bacterium]
MITNFETNEALAEKKLLRRIRRWLAAFMILLIISGITASPVLAELSFAMQHKNWFPEFMQEWLVNIYTALQDIDQEHPYVFYAFDWLAFAHVIIALFFIGVYKNPVQNAWVLRTGMIACIAIIPLAFIAGGIREIPWFWRLIDCSFGVFGIIPLLLVERLTGKLKIIKTANA